jgi:hypothetical protein
VAVQVPFKLAVQVPVKLAGVSVALALRGLQASLKSADDADRERVPF